ncbi:MAG: MCP four helix bundle domain-containing protein, partial [Paracoccus sp. (in: a-proteobacteria)]|uniref:MCP four helix bundle domain-containing protein n=1 Tax=Paracoccus sp. TaxID=267 RepID=UPI0040582D15
MTIKAKLAAVFLAIIAGLGILSYTASTRMSALNAQIIEISDVFAASRANSLRIQRAAASSMELVRAYLATSSRDEATRYMELIDGYYTKSQEYAAALSELLTSDREKGILERYTTLWSEFVDIEAEVRPLGLENSTLAAAAASVQIVEPAYTSVMASLDATIAPLRKQIADSANPDPGMMQLEAALDGGMDELRAMFDAHQNMQITRDVLAREAAAEAILTLADEFEAKLAMAYDAAMPRQREAVDAIAAAWAPFNEAMADFADLARQSTDQKALVLMEERLEPTFLEVVAVTDELSEAMGAAMQEGKAGAAAVYEQGKGFTLIISGLVTALSIIAAIWLSLTISRGLGRAVSVAREVARGNLDVDARSRSRDEIGALLNEMDGMVV